jgi:uncharacterized membrane protein YfcA
MEFLILIVLGFFVGILGSVFGIGGGIFIVPVLVLFLNVPIHQAIAVSLIAIIMTSSAVASVNVERGLTNIRLGIVLETTTAIGSIIGAVVSNLLPARIVQIIFSIILFPVSGLMFYRAKIAKHVPSNDEKPSGRFDAMFYDPAASNHVKYRVRNTFAASIISFFAGSLSGLLGIGGGVVQVPVMNLLCGVPIKAAATTSNFLIGVSACASAIVFMKNGLIVPDIASSIVLGVLLGSFVGIKTLYRAKSEKIQFFFAILVILIAIKMLTK